MAELTPTDRLQPCLLDRLTDDEPDKTQESRARKVFSMRQIREAVLRDLSWLLNTPARSATEDFSMFPEVEKSVLNYGVTDLAGLTSSGLNLTQLEAMVTRAIERFEPRVLANTVKVRAVANESQMNRNTLAFEITGDLWAEPVPDHLYLKTELDLETGQCTLRERVGG